MRGDSPPRVQNFRFREVKEKMPDALSLVGRRLAIFMPNSNHAHFLPTAIEALLTQSVQPREICILDDASSDDSARVIREYASRHPHIRPVFLSKNRGVIRNLKEWLEQSSDDYVMFAAADDVVLPGLVEQSLALLAAYPQAGLCSARSRLIDTMGKDLGQYPSPRPLAASGFISPELAASTLMKYDGWFMGNTTIYRRLALVDAGGFDEGLAGFCDGYASRVIALKHGACFIPADLACWRRTRDGVASLTVSQVSTAVSVANRAVLLMTTTHSSYFPANYARRWRGRWLFSTAMVCMQGLTWQDRTRGLASLFGAWRKPQQFSLSLLAMMPIRIAEVVLLAVMRPWDLWTVFCRRVLGRC